MLRLKSLLVALAIITAAPSALACSCMRPGPDAPQPEIIVKARVETVTRSGHGIVARLRVIDRVKGRTPRLIDVHTAGHPAACGVSFKPGDLSRYAIGRNQGLFTANSCMQFLMNYRDRQTIPQE